MIYPLSIASRGKQTDVGQLQEKKMPKSSKNNSVLLCSKLHLYFQHELPPFKNTLHTDKALLL